MTWLKQPLLVTRRSALLLGLVVGLSIGAAIIIATNTVGDLRAERERAIREETLSKGQVIRLVHRVARLERPSALEIDYRIRVGLRRCLRSRACLRLFRRVTRVVKHGGRFVIVGPDGSSSGRTQAGTPAAPGGSRSPSPSRPGPQPSRPPSRPPGRRPSPPSTPQPQSPSRPSVTVPLPVQVCTMLVGINCP